MTFNEWFAANCDSYVSYEDVLRKAWETASVEAHNSILEKLAVEAENDQEPSTVAAYYRRLKK